MESVNQVLTYIFLFIALYFEVFLLITYFESNKSKLGVSKLIRPAKLPTVSIIVPVWNEEATILKTVFSLLKLDYPKDKLQIFIVDDGSTDKTWSVLQRFKRNKQIILLQKENGGKHTALNYALTFIRSDLVGCLDADSFVHPQTLNRIIDKFEENKEVMAVTPSVKVHEPKTIIQLIQKVEYGWGILLRNLFAKLSALYVTPGPFSIFKREVFLTLGGYRKAHNTEDMELALRMQTYGFKIDNAPDAWVYTVAPEKISTLYKQRLRWTYGFLKNIIDYKHMFFKPQYGHLGMIILPAASFSTVSSIYLLLNMFGSWIMEIWDRFIEIKTVGLVWNWPKFELFYFDTGIIALMSMFAFVLTITLLLFSRKMAEGSMRFGRDFVYFVAIYAIISPLWIGKAFYNVVFARNTKWR